MSRFQWTPTVAGAVVAAVVTFAAAVVGVAAAGWPTLLPAVCTCVVPAGIAAIAVPVRQLCHLSPDEQGRPIPVSTLGWPVTFASAATLAAYLVAWFTPDHPEVTVLATVLLIVGACCAAIDQTTHRIPTTLIWTGVLVAVAVVTIVAFAVHQPLGALTALAWGAGSGIVLLTCTLLTAGSPGLADVRLSVMLGVLVGYQGAGHMWAMTLYAIPVASLVAGVQMAVHWRRRGEVFSKKTMALAPFLVGGATVGLVIG